MSYSLVSEKVIEIIKCTQKYFLVPSTVDNKVGSKYNVLSDTNLLSIKADTNMLEFTK